MELQIKMNEKKRQFAEMQASLPSKQSEKLELQQALYKVQALIAKPAPGPKDPKLYEERYRITKRLQDLDREIARIGSHQDESDFWFDFVELQREQQRPPQPLPMVPKREQLVFGFDQSDSESESYEEIESLDDESDELEESLPQVPQGSSPVGPAGPSIAGPSVGAVGPSAVPSRPKTLLVEHFIDRRETQQQQAQRQMINMIEGKNVPSHQVVHLLEQSQCNVQGPQGPCGGDLVLRQDRYVCLKCGGTSQLPAERNRLDFGKTPADRERTTFVSKYTYKKINHFRDWLSQFQAKENTVIPESILDQVRVALIQKHITNFARITPKTIFKVLKELGLPKMYEHKNLICNKISGNPPPFLTMEQERKLRDMFEELQAPFERHRIKGRKNFLSYSYTLHKLLQILGMPKKIYGQFKILQGAQLVAIHDQTWKKMMAELDARKALGMSWPFHPSQ